MKNSKEYSKKVRELYRTLKAKYPKVKKIIYDMLVHLWTHTLSLLENWLSTTSTYYELS